MENLIITSVTGKAVTTSLIVAEIFKKEHRRVLQDIRELTCSQEFRKHHFVHTPYVHSQNGKTYPMYEMTKDGFSFLVMGYTGEKASKFKEDYINAFNAAEDRLKQTTPELSRKQLALMVIEQEEKMEQLQLENSKLKPRSDYFDLIIKSDDLLTMSQTAKVLKLPFGRNKLLKMLREIGVLFKSTNEPKQDLVDKGYFRVKEKMRTSKTGKQIVFLQTFTTQKGLAFLAKKLELIEVPEVRKTVFIN